jgi:hypothetical protein
MDTLFPYTKLFRSDDGTDLATSKLRGNNDKETTHGDAAQNDIAANRNKNRTALRIIID